MQLGPSDDEMMTRAGKEMAVAKEYLRKMNIVSTKGNDDDDKVILR